MLRFYENRLLTKEIIEKLNFKHIIHGYYDWNTPIHHIRYNLDTGDIWVNEIKQFHRIYTLWEFLMVLTYNGISDTRYEDTLFKNLDYYAERTT